MKKTSSVRGRSKSISFEATVQHSAGAKVVRSKQHVDKKNSLQQNTAISGPSTSAKNNSLVGILAQQNSGGPNGVGEVIDDDDEYLARPNQATLAFADILVFENRIAGQNKPHTSAFCRT